MVASAAPTDQLLRAGMQGQMILAPLTRGGNLPFRRLCADFGMRVGVGEMVFARMLLNGDPKERARLRRAANEGLFGVQIATNNVEEGIQAVALARRVPLEEDGRGSPVHIGQSHDGRNPPRNHALSIPPLPTGKLEQTGSTSTAGVQSTCAARPSTPIPASPPPPPLS
jgi:hypothetical protein